MILSLIGFSANAQQYRLYKYNNQIVVVPNQQKKELEGVGIILMNNLSFETVTDPATGIPTKKAFLWLKGCGKTYISDQKIFEVKEGSMVRVRMSEPGKCEVKSWEKF